MPLTGIEIFKLLPKTNCKECGDPTCLAFAMKLAAGKAELSACPYVSEEAKAKLTEAAAPPIIPVTIGVGDRALKVGGETVMFRHEKRFENPPGFALLITDAMKDAEIDSKLEKFNNLQYERIGLLLRPDLVAVKDASGDAARFEAVVNKVKQKTDCGIILMSSNPDILAAGLKVCADRKPLLYAATVENLERMADLAKGEPCVLAVKASSLEELAELTTKLTDAGVKE
ncbi:MAG: acetyl-CoA decarbonylase/synthase complex subunit gamma, partial [Dehalococcoidia bacterium]|nr:acetyl-CoA decarbonylase/synthase complex subunit gamma [Dehalococcoidia bacterium]